MRSRRPGYLVWGLRLLLATARRMTRSTNDSLTMKNREIPIYLFGDYVCCVFPPIWSPYLVYTPTKVAIRKNDRESTRDFLSARDLSSTFPGSAAGCPFARGILRP